MWKKRGALGRATQVHELRHGDIGEWAVGLFIEKKKKKEKGKIKLCERGREKKKKIRS
ncbi:MAG: hypothetical protein LBE67_08215 [Kocuria palustris]|jgi:hypothetical protein|nr:hypothetical protein [Kocuria palustris]